MLAFPNGKRSVRAPNSTICFLRSKRFLILSLVAKLFLSLLFTGIHFNPTCRVFCVNDAARGNVSLYLKIDIYAAAPIFSIFRGYLTEALNVFFLLCFRFYSREFVGQQRHLVNCVVYVDNIL